MIAYETSPGAGRHDCRVALAGGHDAGQVDADHDGPGHRAALGGGVADVGELTRRIRTRRPQSG